MEEVLLYSEDGKTIVGVTDKTVAHISIPSGVERIEDEAFSDCFNLYDVDIADSIIEIGSRSFFDVHHLIASNYLMALSN